MDVRDPGLAAGVVRRELRDRFHDLERARLGGRQLGVDDLASQLHRAFAVAGGHPHELAGCRLLVVDEAPPAGDDAGPAAPQLDAR